MCFLGDFCYFPFGKMFSFHLGFCGALVCVCVAGHDLTQTPRFHCHHPKKKTWPMRNATNSKEWYTWVPRSQPRDEQSRNHQMVYGPRSWYLVILEWTWRIIGIVSL